LYKASTMAHDVDPDHLALRLDLVNVQKAVGKLQEQLDAERAARRRLETQLADLQTAHRNVLDRLGALEGQHGAATVGAGSRSSLYAGIELPAVLTPSPDAKDSDDDDVPLSQRVSATNRQRIISATESVQSDQYHPANGAAEHQAENDPDFLAAERTGAEAWPKIVIRVFPGVLADLKASERREIDYEVSNYIRRETGREPLVCGYRSTRGITKEKWAAVPAELEAGFTKLFRELILSDRFSVTLVDKRLPAPRGISRRTKRRPKDRASKLGTPNYVESESEDEISITLPSPTDDDADYMDDEEAADGDVGKTTA
ncbi:hypothetical protein HK101_007100, partial [Irineochytrium annulatum]